MANASEHFNHYSAYSTHCRCVYGKCPYIVFSILVLRNNIIIIIIPLTSLSNLPDPTVSAQWSCGFSAGHLRAELKLFLAYVMCSYYYTI